MEIINFNDKSFGGFEQGEDILVDTSVLLALTADYDPWHATVLNLFNRYIFPEESIVLLYTNPLIVNEVLHLSTRSLTRFIERFKVEYGETAKLEKQEFIEDMLTVFVEEGILKVLDGDMNSGAADASNVSIANLYGVNFLTTDHTLARNMVSQPELTNIKKVYYTTGRHKSF
jgi:predicted nucleic acid-binding protein